MHADLLFSQVQSLMMEPLYFKASKSFYMIKCHLGLQLSVWIMQVSMHIHRFHCKCAMLLDSIKLSIPQTKLFRQL